MIEVRMGHEHEINWWQVGDTHPGFAQALEHEQPARKIRVDHHILTAHLNKETGMTNESETQFTIAD